MVRFIKIVFAFVIFFAVSSAMANCQDDDYYIEHIDECENSDTGEPSAPPNLPKSQPSANDGEGVVSDSPTPANDESVTSNSNELHECVGGNIDIFLNRVKAESVQIANAINNINKVERVKSITNLCGVTLKRLEESISTIRKADMSGLLAQAQKTNMCFLEVFSWIETTYGKSPAPPWDTIKDNELIKVREVEEDWKSKLKKLEDLQKERSAELKNYVLMKDRHSKSCLDSPKTEGQ